MAVLSSPTKYIHKTMTEETAEKRGMPEEIKRHLMGVLMAEVAKRQAEEMAEVAKRQAEEKDNGDDTPNGLSVPFWT